MENTYQSLRRALARGVVAAVAVAVGIAAWVTAARVIADDGRRGSPPSLVAQVLADAAARGEKVGRDPVVVPPPASEPVTPAASPVQAVQDFLAAEARGDFDGSYRLVGPDDRRALPTSGAWTEAHAAFLPVEGFAIGSVDGATVTASLQVRAGLDPVRGLVPGLAEATLYTVEVETGWLVDFGRTELRPQYAAEGGVRAAVERWVDERRACRRSSASEVAPVAGAPALARRLCGADGVRVHDVKPVDGGDVAYAPLIAAYGDEVASWGRVVSVAADEVSLRVVVAPVGDRWLVAGVLPSASASGQ